MTYRYFISHRHVDAELATILKKHLQGWGVPPSEIFLSSAPTTTTGVGNQIRDDIKLAAKDVKLFMLVFTSMHEDTSWLLWECGLVEDPQTESTRIVVFDCAGSLPPVFVGYKHVEISEESITAFVHQFHRTDDFLPGEGALYSNVADEVVEDRGRQLYNDLSKAIRQPNRIEQRWSYFTLLLPPPSVAKLKKQSSSETLDFKDIANKAMVGKAFHLAPAHFGYANSMEDRTLAEIAEHWKSAVEHGDKSWTEGLIKEMWRGLRQSEPRLRWRPMRSAMSDTNLSVLLIVNQLEHHLDGSVEFKINTYKAPLEQASVRKKRKTSSARKKSARKKK